jgi:cell division FtsZ-interacting protein ZapD
MQKPFSCPVLDDTVSIQSLSTDLAKTMRKLRRDLRACADCPGVDECQVLQSFNSQVTAAIHEVIQEWDLTPNPAS